MSETMKEKVIEKVVDGALEFIADTSKEELIELIEKNKLQKILGKTIESFHESSYFKREYKNVGFEYDKYCVYNLTDAELNVSNTAEQIADAVYKILPRCFLADEDSVYRNISSCIATLYLQRAKVTVQLYDVIKLQHEGFAQIDEGIADVKNIILSKYRDELRFRQEKEVLLKKELRNEVIAIVSEIATNYLLLVLKKSPQYDSEQVKDMLKANIGTIENVIEKMDEIIKEDFCSKPVCVTFVNGLEFTPQEIPYFIFSELYFRNVVLRGTENLLKYKDIMDDGSFIYILRLRNEIQGDLFPPLIAKGQTNVIGNSNVTIDVNLFRNTFEVIGELILLLYRSIV